jgi:hypothetical protein
MAIGTGRGFVLVYEANQNPNMLLGTVASGSEFGAGALPLTAPPTHPPTHISSFTSPASRRSHIHFSVSTHSFHPSFSDHSSRVQCQCDEGQLLQVGATPVVAPTIVLSHSRTNSRLLTLTTTHQLPCASHGNCGQSRQHATSGRTRGWADYKVRRSPNLCFLTQ